jgi:hypothetical protein
MFLSHQRTGLLPCFAKNLERTGKFSYTDADRFWRSRMQIIRHAPGEASLIDGDRNLLDLLATEAGDVEFEAVLERLEAALNPPAEMPRLVLAVQEGLPGAAQTESPLELVVIEEDPHDMPTLKVTRRCLTPNPAALAVMLDRAMRRTAPGAP